MKSHLYHLQLNIDFKNLKFYKDLFEFMGWSTIVEGEEVAGYSSGEQGDLWLVKSDSNKSQDYDDIGLNHIALRVDSVAYVDSIKDFLEKKQVKMLFDTPRHRPEFAWTPTGTYYQIMFKSPDNILFEVVYIGEK
ncbi:MAG: hypothetical protein O3B87_04525 [bacterium]|nr:hypothetical protein [bacterium]